MRVLISPDSLKGSLSAGAAARAVADGLTATSDVVDAVELPLADGGEGIGSVLSAALGGVTKYVRVEDPLGRQVSAPYVVLPDGRAVVETASAAGLPLLTEDELDPLRASSRGVGQLLQAALDDPDVTSALLGVGGVATVDGGAGLRETLNTLRHPVQILSDVTNPLLGPNGAAAVFGPQKGATADQIVMLEARLRALNFPSEIADHPGAGAAGGISAMLLSLGATLTPGIEFVLDAVNWSSQAAQADLVVTGEGAVDRTSLQGKVVSGVCRAAQAAGTPVIVFGGRVDPDAAEALLSLGAIGVIGLSGQMRRASRDLHDIGSTLSALITLNERLKETA